MHENLFAHTVAVMRLHLAKMNNSLIIFTFFNTFPTTPSAVCKEHKRTLYKYSKNKNRPDEFSKISKT